MTEDKLDPKNELASVILDAIKNNRKINSATILNSENNVIVIDFQGEGFFVEVMEA